MDWQIFAGNPTGPGMRNGPAAQALFNNPGGVACDTLGNRYVADTTNHVIRKISSTGETTTLAGSPRVPGNADGHAADARFNEPFGIALDHNGSLFVTEFGNHTVRKITSSGEVSTVAGTGGIPGAADGPAGQASFNYPAGLAVDSENRIYVADSGNHTIRRISPEGFVGTIAGLAGAYGSADGPANTARFSNPSDVCITPDGSICVTDSGNNTIRRISTAGEVSTVAGLAGVDGFSDGAGANARFSYPTALDSHPDGKLIVADTSNQLLRIVTPAGLVSSLAGAAGLDGFADGAGNAVRFSSPQGISLHPVNGEITVADSWNHALRTVTPEGLTTTLAGGPLQAGASDGTGTAARFNSPSAMLALADGRVAVTDTGNHTIRSINAAGETRTIAGIPRVSGSTNGNATSSTFSSPAGITVDTHGNFFIADRSNKMIRKLSSAGVVSTHAVSPTPIMPENQWVNDTRFRELSGLAVAPSGSVYFADYNQIRRVNPDGTIVQLAGKIRQTRFTPPNTYISFWEATVGNNNGDGTGTNAVIGRALGLSMDSLGNIYFADSSLHTIRRCTPEGAVTTVAGMANQSGSLDATGTTARFKNPSAVALAPDGTLYVTDSGNHLIRKISPGGVVTTIGGTAGLGSDVGETGPRALFSSPGGVAYESLSGTILVADTANQRIMRGTPASAPQLIVEGDGGSHLTSNSNTIDFGTVTIGAPYPAKSVLLRNVGNQPLAIHEVTSESGTADAFEILWTGTPDSIAPGGFLPLGIRFNPANGTNHSIQLRIRTNDPEQPDFLISLTGTGNHAPGFSGYSFSATAGQTVKVSLRKLLAATSDLDGDALTITTSGAPTRLGYSARIIGGELVYTTSSSTGGNDQFQIIFTDARGATTTGNITVNLAATATANLSQLTNPPKLSLTNDGKASLLFHGIPGRSYIIQRSTDLKLWTTVATVTAAPNGLLEWTDPTVSIISVFYRLGTL